MTKFKPEEIYVQTTEDQAGLALRECPELVEKNCLVEPETRDHGPAMGLMALRLSLLDPDEPFILVQADVLRDPFEKFLETINVFEKNIKDNGKLITAGIKPDYHVMGVDYLKVKNLAEKVGDIKVFQMDSWVWRDSGEEEIKEYLDQGKIFLHANHYAWTPRLLLEAYQKYAPDWYQPLMSIKDALGKTNEKATIRDEYSKMTKGPVERITSEVLKNGFVIKLPFKWIDFGTWASLQRYDDQENREVKDANFLEIDSQHNYIKKPANKFLALIGVNDVIVVDTEDGLLICHKEKTGQVGEVVNYLKEKGKTEYL